MAFIPCGHTFCRACARELRGGHRSATPDLERRELTVKEAFV
jgi:hypothetical protein